MNDSQHPVESPEPRLDAAAFAARRRRLLKIAGGAAPAALMLVGRPVHATYNCASTSAWGSAQMSVAQSVRLGQGTPVKGHTLDEWFSKDQPWNALYSAVGAKTNFSSWKTSVKIGTCVPKAPVGLSTQNAVFEAIRKTGKCSTASDFSRLLLVALLNHRLYPERESCVSTADLVEMASGTFYFSPTVTWRQSEILSYVESNNLAVRG
jgi:hypothetical protein